MSLELSSQEIDELLTEKEKQKGDTLSSLLLLETEDNMLSKTATEIQLKRKAIKDGILKGKYNLQAINSELKQLEREKWQILRRERGY